MISQTFSYRDKQQSADSNIIHLKALVFLYAFEESVDCRLEGF